MLLVGLAGIRRCCGGLWTFLIVRANGRTEVELERERNRATAEVIQLIPAGCELLEYEPRGRLRVIRKSGAAASETAVTNETLPGSGAELGR